MATTTTSKQFTLNLRDILRSVLMSAIGAGLGALYSALTTTPVNIDWRTVGVSALTAGVGYAIKNFFQPSTTIITPTPPPASGK